MARSVKIVDTPDHNRYHANGDIYCDLCENRRRIRRIKTCISMNKDSTNLGATGFTLKESRWLPRGDLLRSKFDSYGSLPFATPLLIAYGPENFSWK